MRSLGPLAERQDVQNEWKTKTKQSLTSWFDHEIHHLDCKDYCRSALYHQRSDQIERSHGVFLQIGGILQQRGPGPALFDAHGLGDLHSRGDRGGTARGTPSFGVQTKVHPLEPVVDDRVFYLFDLLFGLFQLGDRLWLFWGRSQVDTM